MTAVEPERCRDVVDRDAPSGDHARASVDKLETGIHTGRAIGVGEVGAWGGEGRLSGGVIASQTENQRPKW